MAKILVVEDEQSLAKVIVNALVQERYTVEHSPEGDEASARLACNEYDLVILDWSLPGKTGIELCTEMRQAGSVTPILMLTGRTETGDRITGLDSGCDDYLTKPFDIGELQARVRALLRRTGDRIHGQVLKFEDLELDKDSFTVSRAGRTVQLLPKEFALLEFFIRHPNVVFSAEILLKRVWTIEEEAAPDIIRTHVKNLRKKLEIADRESPIQTIHGVGYKLQPTLKQT